MSESPSARPPCGRERQADPRPHVLVLANRLPYPVDDGSKTRIYHLVNGFAHHASVTLLTFHDGPEAAVDAFRAATGENVEVVTIPAPPSHSLARLLLGLVTRTPVYIWNTKSSAYRRELVRLVAERRPSTVVSMLTYMYPYVRELPPTTRRVVDTHNIDSVVLGRYSKLLQGRLRRAYAAITARKLRRFEQHVFTDAHQVWVCSDTEAALARQIAPTANVLTIPNGVDTETIAPIPEIAPLPNRLVFFGRMDYEPNRDAIHFFVREILPELRQRETDLEVQVVGGGIGADLEALANATPELRLVGRVDDLRPVLAEAAVVVVPLRMGGGTRLKILEALSLGKPVVSTSLGAEGLRLTSGKELLLADSPADFAAAVSSALHDPSLRQRLGAAGRATAVGRYDWTRIQDHTAASLHGRGRI
jgi:polysaccharide biosynthesis protein PslH